MKKITMLLAVLTGIFAACHIGARGKVEDKVAFHDDLNYSPENDRDAGFDLYTPKNVQGKTPAVIFLHGGYWRNQTRSYYRVFTGLYQNIGLAFASRGIATAVIDYRLYPRAKFEDQMTDVANAVTYLKNNAEKYAIDVQKIYLVGHSAGGHLALMALWQKRNADIAGAIALSPILDVAHMRQHKEADFNRDLTQPFFGTGGEDAKFSPATYADPASRPALMIFGEKDYPYLIEQGKKYSEKFAAAKLSQLRTVWVPETDHADMVLHIHSADDKVSDLISAYIMQSGGKK